MIVRGRCVRRRRRYRSNKGGGRCGGVAAGRTRRCVRPGMHVWSGPTVEDAAATQASHRARATCVMSVLYCVHTAPCRSLARDRGCVQRSTVVAPPPPGAVRRRSGTQSPGQRSSRVWATRGCGVQRQDVRTPCWASRIFLPGAPPALRMRCQGGVCASRACETHAFCRRRVCRAGVRLWCASAGKVRARRTRSPGGDVRARVSRVTGRTMATRPAGLRGQRGAVMRGGVRPCVGARPE